MLIAKHVMQSSPLAGAKFEIALRAANANSCVECDNRRPFKRLSLSVAIKAHSGVHVGAAGHL